jgi:hypothetical protein
MLSNTFIVSEFVEILYSFPTWSCVKMCHTVPRPVQPSNVSCGTTTSAFQLAMCHAYHDQCISPGNVLCGTTTNVFHMAMCHMVPRTVYFTWHYVIRYHDQCISHGNVSYGTTTSVFQLAMYHTLPRPVLFI